MTSVPLESVSGFDASSSSIDPSRGVVLKLSSESFGSLLALAVEFLAISCIGDHGRKERGKRVFVECGGARCVVGLVRPLMALRPLKQRDFVSDGDWGEEVCFFALFLDFFNFLLDVGTLIGFCVRDNGRRCFFE